MITTDVIDLTYFHLDEAQKQRVKEIWQKYINREFRESEEEIDKRSQAAFKHKPLDVLRERLHLLLFNLERLSVDDGLSGVNERVLSICAVLQSISEEVGPECWDAIEKRLLGDK